MPGRASLPHACASLRWSARSPERNTKLNSFVGPPCLDSMIFDGQNSRHRFGPAVSRLKSWALHKMPQHASTWHGAKSERLDGLAWLGLHQVGEAHQHQAWHQVQPKGLLRHFRQSTLTSTCHTTTQGMAMSSKVLERSKVGLDGVPERGSM